MYSSAEKLYDLTSIYAMCDKNSPFMEKLLLVFVDNLTSDLRMLNAAADVGNWEEVSSIAHKMKPSLIHFGVSALKDVVLSLEHPGNYNLNQFVSLVSELDRVVNEVLTGIKSDFPNIFN
jgi:HPt (histidine-containing phosphotransfer) domain-containing protein